MFSPNVWSFEPPNSLITTKIDELTEKCVKQTIKRIQSHPFNKLVCEKKKKWNSQCGVATHWRHHSQRRQCVCDIFAISKIDLFFSSSLLFLHRLCVSAIVNLNFSFRFALSIRRHFEVVVRCCKIKIEFWVAIFTRYFSCFYSVSVRSALLFPTCVRYQIR